MIQMQEHETPNDLDTINTDLRDYRNIQTLLSDFRY